MIPSKFEDLIESKNFGSLATVNPDGSPQVTPVWIDYDKENEYIQFNTAKGRVKYNNILNNPSVAITIFDMENPYRNIAVQGKAEIIDEGEDAVDHINALAKKYMGVEEYPNLSDDITRVKLRIKPEKVATMDS